MLDHLLPGRALRRILLTLLVSFAGFMASGSASALTRAVGPAFCSGGGQLCNVIPSFSINLAVGGVGQGQFISSSPLACSSVRVHFYVDGTEVAVTGFVGPGQTSSFVSLGFVNAGKHTIGVQAEGEVGGCNVGTLFSWAGRVRLQQAP